MENDKLYNAARSEAFDLVDCAHQTDKRDLVEAFVQGAEWLQSQPIADRLTEEEREKIKEMYADLIPLKGHMAGIVGQMILLEKIFGKEMFEK